MAERELLCEQLQGQ